MPYHDLFSMLLPVQTKLLVSSPGLMHPLKYICGCLQQVMGFRSSSRVASVEVLNLNDTLA